MWGTLENMKLSLSLFTTVVFTQRKLPFKIEFKYILFHKPTCTVVDKFLVSKHNHFNVEIKRTATEQ